LELFFYKVSNTQTGPFEANTGLKFVTKETVEPYVTKSRFEGTTATAGVVK
jgi:simple sugar transport system substrate-binding protein